MVLWLLDLPEASPRIALDLGADGPRRLATVLCVHRPYAYPATIGAMLTIAGGMCWFFRSRGWLD